MDKETLSNYGWIVIAVLVLVVMIALAGPFGNFVADAVKSTTQGLFDTNKNALDAAGVPGLTVQDQSFGLKSYAILNAPETVTKADQAVFCSEADIDKFVEVKVDGDVVDDANYTVTEGSTIITFTPEYTKTLENGNHTIEIVSNDGIAECEFSVDIPNIVGSATFREFDLDIGLFGEPVTLTWEELKDPANSEKYCGANYRYDASAITDTTIGEWAFDYCYSLESITLPEGITTIDSCAFYHTHSMESITLPSSLTTIGEGNFHYCTSLKRITFNGTIEQWNSIQKEQVWNYGSNEITVTCTDGTIIMPTGIYD